MGNQSAPLDLPYYPLTVPSSGPNDNIIIGLLVGLLVGVTTLVLLTGAILVSGILKNAKRQTDTNACNVEQSIDTPQTKAQNVQSVTPAQWPPDNVHPLWRGDAQVQGLNNNSINKATGPSEVPRVLTTGRWAPTEVESRPPPSHVETWQYGLKDGNEGFPVR